MSKSKKSTLANRPAFELAPSMPTGDAWGYFRYSDDRLQEKDSIDQQLLACREDARRHGQEILDDSVFADPGEKGWMESRPQLDRMMDLIRSGKARPTDLYVFDTSRAARSMEFALRLQRFFDHYRIRVHFVVNGMTSGTPGFKLQHAVHALIDEEQCVKTGQNVRRGHINQMEKGCYAFCRVYGYDHVDLEDAMRAESQGRRSPGRLLVINPVEAEVVRMIFKMYRSGLGFSAVATQLNKLGVKSPRIPRVNVQRTWRPGTVRSILTNPKYTGLVRYGVVEKRRDPETSKHINVRRPDAEVREYQDESIRIISDEEFREVLELRRSRDSLEERRKVAGFNKARGIYPWSGLLICGGCGGMINICQPGTYICVTAYRGGNCKNRLKLNRASFQENMARLLASKIRDTTTVEDILHPLVEEIKRQSTQAERTAASRRDGRSAVESKLAQVERALTNLMIVLENNPHLTAISDRMSQLQIDKNLLLDQMAESEVPLKAALTEDEVRSYLEGALEELGTILMGDPHRFREELRKRVAKVVLTPIVFGKELAWEIAGDLQLFGQYSRKMVERTSPPTAHHFGAALSLTGLTLKIDQRGVISGVTSSPKPEISGQILPTAA